MIVRKRRLLEIVVAKNCLSNVFCLETRTKTRKVTISFFVTINHGNHFHIPACILKRQNTLVEIFSSPDSLFELLREILSRGVWN